MLQIGSPVERNPLTLRSRFSVLRAMVADQAMGVCAFDARGVSAELPPEIAELGGEPIDIDHISYFTDGASASHQQPDHINVWLGRSDELLAQIKSVGAERIVAELAEVPGSTRAVVLIDLLSEHGVIIGVVGVVDVVIRTDPDGSELRPRQGKMLLDAASGVLEIDDDAIAMMGYDREFFFANPTLVYMHPDDHDNAVERWIELLDNPGATERHLVRYQRDTGHYFWAEVTNTNLLDTEGHIEREVLDVDDRLQAVLEAEAQESMLHGLADLLPSGIAIFDRIKGTQTWNDRWKEITGLSDEQLAEYTQLDDYAGLLVDPSEVVPEAAAALNASDGFDTTISIAPADGSPIRRCRLAWRVVFHGPDNAARVVACLDDITESWLAERRLIERARTDSLTGLLNREGVLETLDACLEKARKGGGVTGLVYLDVNGFKRINDVLGHSFGDQVLQHLAQALRAVVRPSDFLSRHGGDEFMVVMPNAGDAANVVRLARRLLNAASGRMQINDQMIDCDISVGVSVDDGGDHTAERMIAEADIAMYERKRSSSAEIGLFAPEMFDDQRLELNVDAALRHAAIDDSLRLHFQPIVNIETEEVVGYEALIRWMFEGEMMFPDTFIGLAERTGLIEEIGDWVIEEVARQAGADTGNLFWTLNVSPVQLERGALDEVVLRALDRHGCDPQRLGLELTESTAIARTDDTLARLQRLADAGVSLIVDDFGTGFSSYDQIRTLPISAIKVDRSFTNDLELARSRAVVANIVRLAKDLDMRCVVEGVETPAQQAILKELGATTAQGYLFGRPAPLDDFAD